jgi:hypothetical protein
MSEKSLRIVSAKRMLQIDHVCATLTALRAADRELCLKTDLDAAEEHMLQAWEHLQAAVRARDGGSK